MRVILEGVLYSRAGSVTGFTVVPLPAVVVWCGSREQKFKSLQKVFALVSVCATFLFHILHSPAMF